MTDLAALDLPQHDVPEATPPAKPAGPPLYTRAGLHALWLDIISRKTKMTTAEAVSDFLHDMKQLSDRMYPQWLQRLQAHIEETDMPFEEKRNLIEQHDLELYFFTSIVSIEAIKVYSLFESEVADEILSDINDQIDGVLGRGNREASDLCFYMFRTIKFAERQENLKPHDQVMKWVSRLLDLDTIPETKSLTNDIVFRQEMAEPLAHCFVHWWLGFKDINRLAPVYHS